MAITNNLLSNVQNFITPDVVNKISSALGLGPENTKSGLIAVIPTLLMGLVHKGSTPDGAQGILNMIQQSGFTGETPAAFTDRLRDGGSIENTLRGGTEAAQGLFGSKFNAIVDKLGGSTGLHPSGMTKLLGLATPLVLGVLGDTVKKLGLNAVGLSNLLGQQKSLLSGFIPPGLLGDVKISDMKSLRDRGLQKKSKSWLPFALGALLLVAGGMWLIRSQRSTTLVSERPPERETVSGTTRTVQPPAQQAPATAPEKMAAAEQINSFLTSNAQGEIPKRFRFENLTFESGSATVTPESKDELNRIASALKDHPSAKIRVEGFTDNTGSAAVNKSLSSRRALTIKEQLVSLGVEADRIAAAGFGEEHPIASNSTEDGRKQNRRTELVVVQR